MARFASAVVIAWFVVLVAGIIPVNAQGPPLRIIVLSGEDSVNVIQQKTAVAPLVEVRDRNNNPVAGAVVTFAVQGGKAAAFQGGATTMTIATNAAGALSGSTITGTFELSWQHQQAVFAFTERQSVTLGKQ